MPAGTGAVCLATATGAGTGSCPSRHRSAPRAFRPADPRSQPPPLGRSRRASGAHVTRLRSLIRGASRGLIAAALLLPLLALPAWAKVHGPCCGKSVVLSEQGFGFARHWDCARDLPTSPEEVQRRVCQQLNEADALCPKVAPVCDAVDCRDGCEDLKDRADEVKARMDRVHYLQRVNEALNVEYFADVRATDEEMVRLLRDWVLNELTYGVAEELGPAVAVAVRSLREDIDWQLHLLNLLTIAKAVGKKIAEEQMQSPDTRTWLRGRRVLAGLDKAGWAAFLVSVAELAAKQSVLAARGRKEARRAAAAWQRASEAFAQWSDLYRQWEKLLDAYYECRSACPATEPPEESVEEMLERLQTPRERAAEAFQRRVQELLESWRRTERLYEDRDGNLMNEELARRRAVEIVVRSSGPIMRAPGGGAAGLRLVSTALVLAERGEEEVFSDAEREAFIAALADDLGHWVALLETTQQAVAELRTIERQHQALREQRDALIRALPLHEVARYAGQPELLAAALESGGDLGSGDEEGRGPLHWAARNAGAAAVELLLEEGADAASRDGWGRTPLHYAAARNADAEVVRTLVRRGADVNAADKADLRPLHTAARYGVSTEVLHALLEAGAQVDAPNGEGWTPLHVAARYDAGPEWIRALLGAGADREARTGLGWTPLLLAVRRGEPAVVQVLLAAGADVESANNAGWRPLHVAARFGEGPGMVELLAAAGASLEASTGHGLTALQLAALNGRAAVVRALLAAGAEVDGRGEGTQTPLHLAARHARDPAVITALLDAGADAAAMTDEGISALELIEENEALRGTEAHRRLQALAP